MFLVQTYCIFTASFMYLCSLLFEQINYLFRAFLCTNFRIITIRARFSRVRHSPCISISKEIMETIMRENLPLVLVTF